MKKNKLVAFSLCAALLATTLTGCGGDKAQDNNNEADSKEPVSISFMTARIVIQTSQYTQIGVWGTFKCAGTVHGFIHNTGYS